jgi:cytochrome c oxidase cbb3-type subunit III
MKTRLKKIITMLPVVVPGIIFAQAKEPQQSGANPLLWLLIILIILLAFAISALAAALRNISHNQAVEKNEEKKPGGATGKIAGLTVLFLFLQQSAFAAVPSQESGAESVGGIPFGQFYFLVAVIAIELVFLFTLLSVLKLRFEQRERIKKPALKPKEKTIIDKINASVDLEKEADILLDHDYDGIKELDNSLPPWWKYGFYISIIAAITYLIHFHVAKTGDLQVAELEKEIKTENEKITAYLKSSSNNVDELTVKYLDSPSDIETGKEIFTTSCSACHGNLGQGGVGPNLTDDYWLHGGGIADIFKSVKYGWTDKGMKSWKEELSPMKIAQVSSFIKSLRGTNPPNPKEKQGDLYSEEGSTGSVPAGDSLKAKQDTL